MSHYCIESTISEERVNISSPYKYYIKGMSSSSKQAFLMEDGVAKQAYDLIVVGSNAKGLRAVDRLFVTDEPKGIVVKEIPLMDTFKKASIDTDCIYSLTGKFSKSNTDVHIVNGAYWTPSMSLSNESSGYLGKVTTDSEGNFSIDNINIPFQHSTHYGKTTIIPKFPDGILDTYPYYVVIKVNSSDTTGVAVFSDQAMYIIEDEFLNSSNKRYNEGLHMPGNYARYTFDCTGSTQSYTKIAEGNNGQYNIGGSITATSICTCNFTIYKDANGSEVFCEPKNLMAVLMLVTEDTAKYSVLKNHIYSNMRLNMTSGLNDADLIYTTIPAVEVDGNGWGSNDYPQITISGTCPSGTSCVYVSLADFANGSATEIANTSYGALFTNVLCSQIPTSDGTFTNTFNAVYHENINKTSSQKYKKVTDFTAFAVWCEGTGTITADVTNITHVACLSKDTLITLSDGSKKRMDEITMDDVVMAGDGTPAKITKLSRGVWSNKHILYHFSDGSIVDETYEHRFFNITQGYWQKLKLWNIGDEAKRIDGKIVSLVKVEEKNERAEQFGIWTESHDYYASDLLSGDVYANLKLLSNAEMDQFVGMISSIPTNKLIAGFEEEEQL